MFDIFKKNKKIILDCFCVIDYVYDYAPIDYGSKFYPTWWKETPSIKDDDTLTIKNCTGFIDFYKKSVVIPSWFDMELEIFSDDDPQKRYYSYESSNRDTLDTDSHHQMQFEKFALKNGHNMKLTSPWAFKTKENICWTWTQPTWNLRNNLRNFTVLPAVVNYKYQHSTNINFFMITDEKSKKTRIEPRTPLVILHPMTEREIEIKNHLVEEKEFKRLMNVDNLFFKRTAKENSKLYSSKKKLIDSMECPINHGKI